ncbi:EF-hand calcium-binding domain-containing protein 7-like [Paramacrobiotus metropolitanus]|uniref:EF-hand calcium-binding domain-containing protein 7-like n=1 Tax=Paramacrobiotus metropolitanus TaxID=2943436 RepID=UPI002446075D|nr:EF-hand calcium-binding domain-containing protein 7-like [Paramacrobiotus metropolitanus]
MLLVNWLRLFLFGSYKYVLTYLFALPHKHQGDIPHSTAPYQHFANKIQPGRNVLVSASELWIALQRTGKNPTRTEAKQYWSKYSDNNKVLDFETFKEISKSIPNTTQDEFFKAVRALYGKENYLVPSESLRELLTSGPESLPLDEIDRIILSHTNSGHVNLLELWTSFEQTAEQCAGIHDGHLIADRRPVGSFRESFEQVISAYTKRVPRDCACIHARGFMVFDDASHLFAHQYDLYLSEDTELTVSIQLVSLPLLNPSIDPAFNNIDAELFLLRDADSSGHKKLTAFTNVADAEKCRFTFRTKAAKGQYTLVPFTTGAWFSSQPQLQSTTNHHNEDAPDSDHSTGIPLYHLGDGELLELSEEYSNALEAVFELTDLDGNDNISRNEFDIFAKRSTGDIVRDDDWNVVTTSFPVHNDQLTRDGFMKLHINEATDCAKNDDVTDMWIMLESMGFNRQLVLNRTMPFVVFLTASNCNPRITPTEMKLVTTTSEKAIIRTASELGVAQDIGEDVIMYKVTNGLRVSLVVENRGAKTQFVECDVKEMENCRPSKKLPLEMTIPPKKTSLIIHFVPIHKQNPWRVNTKEAVKVV